MARKNDGLHPILILLGLIAFIIVKIVDFVVENIIPILTILGFGLGIFLVYYILKQRNKQKTKKQPNKKAIKQANVPLVSMTVDEKPKTNYSDKSVIDIIPQDISLSVDESVTKKIETSTPLLINKENEKIVTTEDTDVIAIHENNYNEQMQSITKTIDEEIKSYAETKYPNDSEMQKYTYKEQLESKISMSKFHDTESIKFAQNRYPDDYSMQVYTYKEQIASKKYMSQTNDQEISEYAVQRYPQDYSMQEYTYNEQLKSKAFMQKVAIVKIKQYVENKYPDDYTMQEYIYKEQIVLTPCERSIYQKETDETIIDVNSEKLDLSIDQSVSANEISSQPPFWGHIYVYSYDEMKYATQEQKKYYFYFKNKFLKGELVDIHGYTNYAFILYFDLLNEYENHNDVKLLEEQFKLLGQICPKTKRYAVMSLRGLLMKRSDSHSSNRLNKLEDPSYQFEHDLSNNNSDTFRLGNQYKDKLSLDKQEVNWLNKFDNPTNVFTSIEGCRKAIVLHYLIILKEIDKHFVTEGTSISKEIGYLKDKFRKTCSVLYSEYNYSVISNMVVLNESNIYLTIFKRIENYIREQYGHKTILSSDFLCVDKEVSDGFEIKFGNKLNELIEGNKDKVIKPNFETIIALNFLNINRWKIEFNSLKEFFKKDEVEKFVQGVIILEQTNQKNPNIENIFFEASKFIAEYNKIQSLKYYAKYIYYDLKSKKFDNRELTKTIQKSLFKTNEQISDFKRIIAELIETSNIEKALDEIAKIDIPKRKKIKLDKSKIKEVEHKHDGTVELLNEYLATDSDDSSEDETFENEEIQINIITPEISNSIFISEIRMGKVQEELVKKIVANSFEIHQTEVEKFALESGMFKNQLIDSINEACSEHLDGEPLIEEEDESYVIEKSYYNEIAI